MLLGYLVIEDHRDLRVHQDSPVHRVVQVPRVRRGRLELREPKESRAKLDNQEHRVLPAHRLVDDNLSTR